jgi:hypothetical protein
VRVKTRCGGAEVLTSLVAMVGVCLLIGIDRDFLDKGCGKVDGKVVWKVVQARYVVRSWELQWEEVKRGREIEVTLGYDLDDSSRFLFI